MNFTGGFMILALLISATWATNHTACYNHFIEKDGCVFSADDNGTRCDAACKTCKGTVTQFKQQPLQQTRLARRYDSYKKVFPVAGGSGICGDYDTNKDEGVCLWTGTSSSGEDPATAGWLNGATTTNCHRRVFIQRKGHPEFTVFAPVKDGCSFDTFDVNLGCFQLALTNKTFNALNPTPEERAQQGINDVLWDFDNLFGYDPQQAPV